MNSTNVQPSTESTIVGNNVLAARIRKFKCVDKQQAESDYYHADWRIVEAKTRNEAKVKYSRLAKTEYINVLCYAWR